MFGEQHFLYQQLGLFGFVNQQPLKIRSDVNGLKVEIVLEEVPGLADDSCIFMGSLQACDCISELDFPETISDPNLMIIIFGMSTNTRTSASSLVDESMVSVLSVPNSAGITDNFHSVFLILP
jgi:hypothetical protein